jgi:transcription initiation factor TFIIIB Brf1 subunit/transcription initiation factor TFIIB
MPHPENLCPHLNEIIDERAGAIVCTDCGLVISDFIFKHNYQIAEKKCKKEEEIKEILERMHLPGVFTSTIIENYEKSLEKEKKSTLPFIVYETLNKMGFPISIKDISAVSGISDSNIYNMQKPNKSIILQPNSLLEKYCRILGMDYKTYSLIKKELPKAIQSGHNPLTVIGGTIYNYCKKNNLKKYSMKKIASAISISPVSIQRYIKKC